MAISLVVEDGTGLAAANVYDSAATCSAWLSDRGKAVYAAGTSPNQDLWLLLATEIMERKTAGRVDGDPTGGDDQAMMYPRTGATDRRGRLYKSDERPASFRESIFLLAEEIAIAAGKGKSVSGANADANIRSHSSATGSIAYRSAPSFEDLYPEIMARAAESHPSGLYSQRA